MLHYDFKPFGQTFKYNWLQKQEDCWSHEQARNQSPQY